VKRRLSRHGGPYFFSAQRTLFVKMRNTVCLLLELLLVAAVLLMEVNFLHA
jgi:hypothetical protein